ncbi:MAG: bifunctional pyr operon transcriptional regulator/uracil phosphoribosyltransferase PyrR [Candidatus Marivariicella sp.]|nr:MAG: bifunctional pyr operon transcriptional regulator/uracil phosphoribosyltransferase [Flavobacteriaceae bacterium TMED116]
MNRILLDALKIKVLLNRLSCQLIENHDDFSDTVLIGLQPRGVLLLERLVELLKNKYGIKRILTGKLDSTFFRDDFRSTDKILSPNSTEIDFQVEGKKVVFIDDVLFTGRSIRSALTAIDYFGRPTVIELLVLIDRRFSRDLPIQPDYLGTQIDSIEGDKVRVEWSSENNKDCVFIENEIKLNE